MALDKVWRVIHGHAPFAEMTYQERVEWLGQKFPLMSREKIDDLIEAYLEQR